MKRILSWMAAGSFALAGVAAHADEKVETHHEVTKKSNGTAHAKHKKMHKKDTRDGTMKDEKTVESDTSARTGGGAVTETTTTMKHSAPGEKDSKATTKERLEKDANGNVVSHTKDTDGK